jgi:hypothetical protein
LLDAPLGIAELLRVLRDAGADGQVAALLTRNPAKRVRLEGARSIARFLDEFREAGAHRQIATLVERDPATHVRLDDAMSLLMLLRSLRTAGAEGQVATLLARRPADHVLIDAQGHFAGRLAEYLEELGDGTAAERLRARMREVGVVP